MARFVVAKVRCGSGGSGREQDGSCRSAYRDQLVGHNFIRRVLQQLHHLLGLGRGLGVRGRHGQGRGQQTALLPVSRGPVRLRPLLTYTVYCWAAAGRSV